MIIKLLLKNILNDKDYDLIKKTNFSYLAFKKILFSFMEIKDKKERIKKAFSLLYAYEKYHDFTYPENLEILKRNRRLIKEVINS